MSYADRDLFRVFVNLNVPDAQGLALVRTFAECGLAERTSIVAAITEQDTLAEAMRLGVLGYIQTSMAVTEFVAAVRRILDGTPVFPELGPHDPELQLSARQLDILRLLHRGLSSKQIAHELNIAVGTAKNHTVALLRRLNATNRAHAVARATQLGLLGRCNAIRKEKRD
jgi:DNA-binding NarL/FixJ family response regulator